MTFLILTPGFIKDCFYQYTHITAFKRLCDSKPERLVALQFGEEIDSLPAEICSNDVLVYHDDDLFLVDTFWWKVYRRVKRVMDNICPCPNDNNDNISSDTKYIDSFQKDNELNYQNTVHDYLYDLDRSKLTHFHRYQTYSPDNTLQMHPTESEALHTSSEWNDSHDICRIYSDYNYNFEANIFKLQGKPSSSSCPQSTIDTSSDSEATQSEESVYHHSDWYGNMSSFDNSENGQQAIRVNSRDDASDMSDVETEFSNKSIHDSISQDIGTKYRMISPDSWEMFTGISTANNTIGNCKYESSFQKYQEEYERLLYLDDMTNNFCTVDSEDESNRDIIEVHPADNTSFHEYWLYPEVCSYWETNFTEENRNDSIEIQSDINLCSESKIHNEISTTKQSTTKNPTTYDSGCLQTESFLKEFDEIDPDYGWGHQILVKTGTRTDSVGPDEPICCLLHQISNENKQDQTHNSDFLNVHPVSNESIHSEKKNGIENFLTSTNATYNSSVDFQHRIYTDIALDQHEKLQHSKYSLKKLNTNEALKFDLNSEAPSVAGISSRSYLSNQHIQHYAMSSTPILHYPNTPETNVHKVIEPQTIFELEGEESDIPHQLDIVKSDDVIESHLNGIKDVTQNSNPSVEFAEILEEDAESLLRGNASSLLVFDNDDLLQRYLIHQNLQEHKSKSVHLNEAKFPAELSNDYTANINTANMGMHEFLQNDDTISSSKQPSVQLDHDHATTTQIMHDVRQFEFCNDENFSYTCQNTDVRESLAEIKNVSKTDDPDVHIPDYEMEQKCDSNDILDLNISDAFSDDLISITIESKAISLGEAPRAHAYDCNGIELSMVKAMDDALCEGVYTIKNSSELETKYIEVKNTELDITQAPETVPSVGETLITKMNDNNIIRDKLPILENRLNRLSHDINVIAEDIGSQRDSIQVSHIVETKTENTPQTTNIQAHNHIYTGTNKLTHDDNSVLDIQKHLQVISKDNKQVGSVCILDLSTEISHEQSTHKLLQDTKNNMTSSNALTIENGLMVENNSINNTDEKTSNRQHKVEPQANNCSHENSYHKEFESQVSITDNHAMERMFISLESEDVLSTQSIDLLEGREPLEPFVTLENHNHVIVTKTSSNAAENSPSMKATPLNNNFVTAVDNSKCYSINDIIQSQKSADNFESVIPSENESCNLIPEQKYIQSISLPVLQNCEPSNEDIKTVEVLYDDNTIKKYHPHMKDSQNIKKSGQHYFTVENKIGNDKIKREDVAGKDLEIVPIMQPREQNYPCQRNPIIAVEDRTLNYADKKLVDGEIVEEIMMTSDNFVNTSYEKEEFYDTSVQSGDESFDCVNTNIVSQIISEQIEKHLNEHNVDIEHLLHDRTDSVHSVDVIQCKNDKAVVSGNLSDETRNHLTDESTRYTNVFTDNLNCVISMNPTSDSVNEVISEQITEEFREKLEHFENKSLGTAEDQFNALNAILYEKNIVANLLSEEIEDEINRPQGIISHPSADGTVYTLKVIPEPINLENNIVAQIISGELSDEHNRELQVPMYHEQIETETNSLHSLGSDWLVSGTDSTLALGATNFVNNNNIVAEIISGDLAEEDLRDANVFIAKYHDKPLNVRFTQEIFHNSKDLPLTPHGFDKIKCNCSHSSDVDSEVVEYSIVASVSVKKNIHLDSNYVKTEPEFLVGGIDRQTNNLQITTSYNSEEQSENTNFNFDILEQNRGSDDTFYLSIYDVDRENVPITGLRPPFSETGASTSNSLFHMNQYNISSNEIASNDFTTSNKNNSNFTLEDFSEKKMPILSKIKPLTSSEFLSSKLNNTIMLVNDLPTMHESYGLTNYTFKKLSSLSEMGLLSKVQGMGPGLDASQNDLLFKNALFQEETRERRSLLSERSNKMESFFFSEKVERDELLASSTKTGPHPKQWTEVQIQRKRRRGTNVDGIPSSSSSSSSSSDGNIYLKIYLIIDIFEKILNLMV